MFAVVTAPPSFVSAPRGRSVAIGRRVSFECEATGSPTPVISWRKERSPVRWFTIHNTISLS